MSKLDLTQSELEEVRRLIGVYGADLERWPAAAAEEFGVRAGHPDLAMEFDDGAAIDQALDLAADRGGGVSAGALQRLQDNILQDFDTVHGRRNEPVRKVTGGARLAFASVFGERPIVPAGALAGLCALGFAVGAVSANADGGYSAEDEAFAHVEAAFGETLINDEVYP